MPRICIDCKNAKAEYLLCEKCMKGFYNRHRANHWLMDKKTSREIENCVVELTGRLRAMSRNDTDVDNQSD